MKITRTSFTASSHSFVGFFGWPTTLLGSNTGNVFGS